MGRVGDRPRRAAGSASVEGRPKFLAALEAVDDQEADGVPPPSDLEVREFVLTTLLAERAARRLDRLRNR